LKDAITKNEKDKVRNDLGHRENSSEEMEPTIAKAEEDSEAETKKHDAKIEKTVDEIAKKQLEEAKKADADLKKEIETNNPKSLA
jgi:hypothetical protein